MIEKLRMFCIGNVKGHLGAVPFQRGQRRFVPQGSAAIASGLKH
jgi:hypothetical protein